MNTMKETNNNRLELKHLAPYLPYGLKIWWEQPEEHKSSIFKLSEKSEEREMSVVTMIAMVQGNEHYKPILRPLTDLTKEELNNLHPLIDDGQFKSLVNISIKYTESCLSDYLDIYNYLLSHHFDVFGLIDKGLAIPMSEIDDEEEEENEDLTQNWRFHTED